SVDGVRLDGGSRQAVLARPAPRFPPHPRPHIGAPAGAVAIVARPRRAARHRAAGPAYRRPNPGERNLRRPLRVRGQDRGVRRPLAVRDGAALGGMGREPPRLRLAPPPARRRLADLERQVLPDGGHLSRNPGAMIELLVDLLPLSQAYTARNVPPPPALTHAIDRMMPMLRFFRHGDGAFALFNGMGPTSPELIATIL